MDLINDTPEFQRIKLKPIPLQNTLVNDCNGREKNKTNHYNLRLVRIILIINIYFIITISIKKKSGL